MGHESAVDAPAGVPAGEDRLQLPVGTTPIVTGISLPSGVSRQGPLPRCGEMQFRHRRLRRSCVREGLTTSRDGDRKSRCCDALRIWAFA